MLAHVALGWKGRAKACLTLWHLAVDPALHGLNSLHSHRLPKGLAWLHIIARIEHGSCDIPTTAGFHPRTEPHNKSNKQLAQTKPSIVVNLCTQRFPKPSTTESTWRSPRSRRRRHVWQASTLEPTPSIVAVEFMLQVDAVTLTIISTIYTNMMQRPFWKPSFY